MRKLATAAFSFAFAIFLAQNIFPISRLIIFSIIAAMLSLAAFLFRKNLRLRIFIIFLSLSIGLLWSWAYTTLFIAPSWHFDEQTISVSSIVSDFPSRREPRGYRVDVVVIVDDGPNIGARVFYFNETELLPGDIIEFTATFRRTEDSYSDRQISSLSARGAFFTAFVSGDITVVEAGSGLRFLPRLAANAIAGMIEQIYPEDVSHFMQALLVGRRDALHSDNALGASLSAAGIIHIVSISGMHISFLMTFLALMIKNKRLFASIGIPVLLLFMAMAGFTPAVTRSGIMQVFLICAPIFKRERDSITSLSAALMVLLIANPYSIASIGLQLSFSATLGIILLTPKISSGLSEALRGSKIYKRKFAKAIITFVTSSFATTIGALVLTIPLTVIHFGYVSLIAPITNLLTLWAVSFAFPIGLISAIFGFIFYPLGVLFAYPVSLAAQYIIFVASTISLIPYSVVYSSNLPIMFWLAYVYIIFISLPLLKVRSRQYLMPSCIAVILLFVIILLSPLLSDGNNSVTVLDIGQGLSVVLLSNGYTAVVDCGSMGWGNAGAIAHEYLLSNGRTHIDLLVITHFHADHVNGIEFLMSRVPVATLAVPDYGDSFVAESIISLARRRGTDIIYVTEVFQVSFGELIITLFPPVGVGCINERGVTVLTEGELGVLITGDMNSATERALIRNFDIPHVDVLVVGHHGSRHSTSHELLYAVSPSIAIISVGRNSFGHPAGEVLDRLYEHFIDVYRTDLMGHVRVAAGR